MRNVFDRPMFQNPNIRRSTPMPSGILASSEELIKASAANASPLNKTFTIPSLNMSGVPGVASTAKNQKGQFIFPRVKEISTEDVDPEAEKTKLEQLKDMAATEKKLATDTAKEKASKTVDDLKTSINNTTQKVLDTKPTDDVEDVSEDVDTTLRTEPKADTDRVGDFDFSPTKQGIKKLSGEISTLYKNYAT